MAVETMQMSVVAQVLDIRHNEEEVYLSCFNSEVEQSIPAARLPLHNGETIGYVLTPSESKKTLILVIPGR